MHPADAAAWHSPSPLWCRPVPCRTLRRFPPHLRPDYRAPEGPLEYRSAPVTFDWLSGIATDFVWQFASPAVATDHAPSPPMAQAADIVPPPARRSSAPSAWLHIVLVGSLCAVSSTTGGQELEGYLPASIPALGAPSNVTVLTRPRPDYDPLGIRAGTFNFQPLLTEGLGFDTNPRGAAGQAGSAFVSTQASVSVLSDWQQHALGASVSVDDRRYLQQPNLNRTDDAVAVGGRYDVGTADRLVVSATHSDLHIEPTGIDAPSTHLPVPYQVTGGTASYLLNLSRLSFEPFVVVNDTTYSPIRVGSASQSFAYLDNTTVVEGVTARYELSPLRRAVVVVRSSESAFAHLTPGEPRRDSVGVSVLGGIDYVADGVFRYRALVGYQVRDYASAAIKSHSAPIVEADVIWSPSVLTTVEAKANRQIVDSTDPLVASYTDNSVKLQVEHEYLRNVLLNAHVSAELAQYEGGGGQQTIYGAGLGASWLLNQNQKLSLGFDHIESTSNTRGNYHDDSLLLKFTAGI